MKARTKKIANHDSQNKKTGSVAPYVLGWFLGVPGSVLFLIFVLRGCN